MKIDYQKKLNILKKKYSFQINFIADSKLIIPEYKIELLNKSKKIIDTVKHIDTSNEIKEVLEDKKIKKTKVTNKIDLKKIKKSKIIKKKVKSPRTLWVRRKKRA